MESSWAHPVLGGVTVTLPLSASLPLFIPNMDIKSMTLQIVNWSLPQACGLLGCSQRFKGIISQALKEPGAVALPAQPVVQAAGHCGLSLQPFQHLHSHPNNPLQLQPQAPSIIQRCIYWHMKQPSLDRLSWEPWHLQREWNRKWALCLEKGARGAHTISHSLKQTQGKQSKREELRNKAARTAQK